LVTVTAMNNDAVRALVVTAHGGGEVLQVQERPRPEPRPGQLLVEVLASGINFIDVYRREGRYPTEPPFVLGRECAGRVIALGLDVTGFAVGDTVATASAGRGSHASVTLLDAALTVVVPPAVSAETAAAAMLQGMTAHYLVNSTYDVQAGDWTLVHAAAGGVGQLLVQLLKARGAHVVATVGTAAKAEIARELGADHVLRYDDLSDLAAAVRQAAGGGVRVAYDGVGAATAEASLRSLAPRGLLALFGAASGPVPPFDLQRLNPLGSLFVTRPTLADYIATRDELVWRSSELFAAIADGSLRVDIGGRYSLDQAAEAYADLEGRRSTGKLLLIP
jgi:NADPH:quinone reductase